MAYRGLIAEVLKKSNLRPLLVRNNPMWLRSQPKSQIRPATDWLNKPSLFSSTVIKKYYEVIPIIVFTCVGVTCEALYTLRLAFTRDDVVYFGKKMPYEDTSRICKNKPPPIRKLIPLVLIMGGAVVGLIFTIVRNSMTRDDVRFSTSSKMLCERKELLGPRKFLVYNQKYEAPKGLAEALAALEEPSEAKQSE